MAHHAEAASRATGMPAHLMLGQAALESGWGKREIKGVDGTPSNNLFGIKATDKWNGKVVETMTTEYINGVKQKRIEKFRAYDNYADSFKDFAKIMINDPRYQNVVANMNDVHNYAQAMQKAGYATDPHYANKLANVIQKITVS
jgi:flagellar protein FlgJ